MPHSGCDYDAAGYKVVDDRAFIAAALALPEATHFTVVGFGPLRKWVNGASRTREVPVLPDNGWDHPVEFQCRLDFVARQAVRHILEVADDDIEKRGIVTIHHWWLRSDSSELVVCWDWHHCGGPIQVDVSLRPWIEELADTEVVIRLAPGRY